MWGLLGGVERGPEKPLFEPGDLVLLVTILSTSPTLDSILEGPYSVILSSPTAVKVAGIDAWIHHTQLKPWKGSSDEAEEDTLNDQEGEESPRYQCTPMDGLKMLFKKDK